MAQEFPLTTTRSIWIKSVASGLIMLVVSGLSASGEAVFSVGIGIAVALLNFWLLERLVSGLLQRQTASIKRLLAAFAAKGLILFGMLGYVVLKVPLEIGYFLLGLSCVVAGIILEGLQGLFFGSAVSNSIGEQQDEDSK